MFVCNIKLNKKIIFKFSLIFMFSIAIIIFFLVILHIVSKNKDINNLNYLNDSIPS